MAVEEGGVVISTAFLLRGGVFGIESCLFSEIEPHHSGRVKNEISLEEVDCIRRLALLWHIEIGMLDTHIFDGVML